MEFRPCIDIHNGQVKQIVGGSLQDVGPGPAENFVSTQDAAFFANLYKERGLKGGHVILLNKAGTPEYEATRVQAMAALRAYPNGLQVGGGITAENAAQFIEAGASHVIVTSYVFTDGKIDYSRLNALVAAVGAEHIVLDLSCRKKGNDYYVVTDRWQKFTSEKVEEGLLNNLSTYCSEFLIHAADVEGKCSGIEAELVKILGSWGKLPMTYAGGIASYEDIELIRTLGQGNLNFTVGSALDIFGGRLEFKNIIRA